MLRAFYLAAGIVSLGLGGLGVVVPLLPTVPFFILAAFCFARSNRALEQWLLHHPKFGRSLRLWREKGAISHSGKCAALGAFALGAVLSVLLLPLPWSVMPLVPALTIGAWIWRRPEM